VELTIGKEMSDIQMSAVPRRARILDESMMLSSWPQLVDGRCASVRLSDLTVAADLCNSRWPLDEEL
jgi:hypothetical protein